MIIRPPRSTPTYTLFPDTTLFRSEGDNTDEAPKTASLSDRLAQRLSAHRTAALQIEVARHPHIALAALVHGMVQAVLQPNAYRDGLPPGLTLRLQARRVGKECVRTCSPGWLPYYQKKNTLNTILNS